MIEINVHNQLHTLVTQLQDHQDVSRAQQAEPVYFRAGQGLSRSTGGTLLQLAVTAPMMPPATMPVPTAVSVRETQSSGLSTGSLSDVTVAGILVPLGPLMLRACCF